jgi:hypothetical protein
LEIMGIDPTLEPLAVSDKISVTAERLEKSV